MFTNHFQHTLRKFLVFGAIPNGVLVGVPTGIYVIVD